MPISAAQLRALQLSCLILLTWMLATAQTNPAHPNKPQPAIPGAEYSGMYAFLRDGEFVQITVEDRGHVTGFVSRFGDSEGDRGVFLDHFFESGQLNGDQLTFATKIVHGISFEFHGTVARGEGKSRGDEGYFVLKGSLTENTIDEAKKTSAHTREVALKSFPQDMTP
jgi:hypothetical protein